MKIVSDLLCFLETVEIRKIVFDFLCFLETWTSFTVWSHHFVLPLQVAANLLEGNWCDNNDIKKPDW